MIAALDGANSSTTGIANGDILILGANDPSFRGFTGTIEYKNYPSASPPFSLTLRGATDANNRPLVVFSGGNTDRWLTIDHDLILNLENLTFQGPSDYVTNPLNLDGRQGGGIVSTYDLLNPPSIGDLAGNTFKNIGIVSSSYLFGGGVVSAYSSSAVAIGNLTGNTFRELSVVSSNELQGGGVVGASSGNSTAIMGNLDGNIFRASWLGREPTSMAAA